LLGGGCLTTGWQRGRTEFLAFYSHLFSLYPLQVRIGQSHSRPRESNDNPFSEGRFKTLKYRPNFPSRFYSLEGARARCRGFFVYYNGVHRHFGLILHTPDDVRHGHAPAAQAKRAEVLAAAYQVHPERFVHRPPAPPALPSAVWINPPVADSTDRDDTEVAAG
jgi:putative transposase